jgi:hypothetical protein
MPEGIVTPDGKKIDLDPATADQIEQSFARAMSEPAGDDKAPPKRAERKPEAPREAPRVKRGRPPKEATAAKAAPVTGLSRDARVEGAKGTIQLTAGLCLVAERGVKSPAQKMALRADAITLVSSADDLAQAVAATAEQDEKFARVVDRVCAAGPYGALISAVLAVGTQCARNHGANVPGTRSPEELVALAEAQAA